MRHRVLGRTGIVVSSQCLGTMTFGAEADERASHALLDAFVEAGGTFLDTADVYSAGASEEIIGRWLATRDTPDGLVIATKGRMPMGDDPNRQGASRRWLTRALEDSLRRLGRDHVDLYQVHMWDAATPIVETLGVLHDLISAGKARAVGVSNYTGWQLQRALSTADHRGLTRPATLQPQYNLLAREIEWELVPVCVDEGVGLLPWGPLGGGWLTGKYRRDGDLPEESRLGEDPGRGVEAWEIRDRERTWAVLDAVREIADSRGVSMAQVALSWVTDRPMVVSTILGARTVEQLADNLGAADLELEPDERERLDEVSAPPTPEYPYGFIDESNAGRRAAAGPWAVG